MKRSKDGKRTKHYDGNRVEPPLDDEDALTTKQEAMDDEQPLVNREDESLEDASSSPLLMQKPVATWAVGGLGVLFLLVVVLVVRVGTLQVSRETLRTQTTTWVEMLPNDVISHLDTDVDPCDDLYAFSCGSWQKNVEIPEDKSSVSLSFSTVNDKNEKVLKDVMQQGWPLMGELYDSCMNFNNKSSKTANDASFKVLSPVLEQIAATKSKKELFQLAGVLYKTGTSFVTGLGVDADAREATVYVLSASQTGLSLPDRQYYLDRKKFDSISDAFHAYVVELFVLVGWESHAAALQASTVIGFEQTLAPLFVPKEKLEDPVATYNRMSVTQAADRYPLVFSQFLKGTGLLRNLTDQNADVIVQTPEFFNRVEKLVTGDSVTLETLKAVLMYQFVSDKAAILSEPFIQAKFSFFARTVSGQKKRSPRWKVCLHHVTDSFPDLMGKYFALRQFDKASEQLASQLVAQIQASMQKNFKQVDWLDRPTRQAAVEKLGNMTNLIGYSTLSEHFPYELRGDALLADNMRIIKEHQFIRDSGKIGGPVNRNKWAMTGAEANAYYQPKANQIVFPAGILQSPFFAFEHHPARNFGSIGSIIGHELTHGFDASGRYYAGDGNLRNWWSNDTANKFSQRADCLVKQYDSFAVTSDADQDMVLGHVNGNYTLSENIADNGGLKLAFNAYQTYMTKQARKLSKVSEDEATELTSSMSQVGRSLPADVADRLFFISFAQTFCGKSSDTMTIQSLATDLHSPARWRINGVASNSHDFARVFSCPASSPMNPKTKCQLW
ncbi:hypothetical protein KXD40_006719 [Peronospora effusa]|uniref:Peptidase M13 C-terminal domain-containing protein n=1 Tax=Peronospora effusa TaxID=542832 RepID=A0A3M6VV46_9STRA|nr:hypothetical protein DD238_000919 [Peronospora effusa]RQM18472.1 hypothetical protein DD237_001816 [Peronospora effusa]UIZ24862.1 hypothetical protein KXD40_006719 [Peronospora effusa]CAI5719136.1 unnamed protein product [Peronospora effusa]